MPGSGFTEKLETQKFSVRYHGTDMTQETLKSMIARIEALPAFKGFEIIKTAGEGGKDKDKLPRFTGRPSGKGSRTGTMEDLGESKPPRAPERVILTARLIELKESQNVVSEPLWKQIETIYGDISKMPEMKALKWNLIPVYELGEYDLNDKYPPKEMVLIFEVCPDEQVNLDKVTADSNFNKFANQMMRYLFGDDTNWQIVKELIAAKRKGDGRG